MKNNAKEIFLKNIGSKIRSFEQITTGLSNNNFKINDAYFIRMPPENRDTTISYKNEIIVLNKIQKLKFVDKFIYFNKETGIKITKNIHFAKPYEVYPSKYQISLVCKNLRKLHKIETEGVEDYDYINKINYYKKFIPTILYLDKKIENKILKQIKKIDKDEEKVLCHNDLVQNNILFKHDDAFIIDWEYAGVNSYYFDLASFISENNLKEEDEIFFLKKYFGSKYTNLKKKKVELFIQLLNLLFYYWAQFMFATRKEPIYLEIANQKSNSIIYN